MTDGMTVRLEITGLDELQKRLEKWPGVFDSVMVKTLNAVLFTVWESIPSYPPQPEGSKYIRKGVGGLGGSFGVSEVGARLGRKPDIYAVSKTLGMYSGEIGSRIKYAKYVVGDWQPRWNSHWWTLHGTVVKKAMDKVNKIMNIAAQEMADFVDRGKV